MRRQRIPDRRHGRMLRRVREALVCRGHQPSRRRSGRLFALALHQGRRLPPLGRVAAHQRRSRQFWTGSARSWLHVAPVGFPVSRDSSVSPTTTTHAPSTATSCSSAVTTTESTLPTRRLSSSSKPSIETGMGRSTTTSCFVAFVGQ